MDLLQSIQLFEIFCENVQRRREFSWVALTPESLFDKTGIAFQKISILMLQVIKFNTTSIPPTEVNLRT